MDIDTFDFLTALTFSAGEDSPILDAPPCDFHPDTVAAISGFVSAFRERCGSLSLDPDSLERSFGGNVYFSLSGHGVGFWDDSGPWGDVFQAALESFAGSKYRFEPLSEELNYWTRGKVRKIDFSVYVKYLEERRIKYFGPPYISRLTGSDLAIVYCPALRDLRIIETGKMWSHPPAWNGKYWEAEPFTVERLQALA